MQNIATLTGLRGWAALMVLIYHAWQTAGAPEWWGQAQYWLAAGYTGVDLFFVLSGFLLGVPLIEALRRVGLRQALARFWQRRLRRVLPAYGFQVLLLSALLCVSADAAAPGWRSLLTHLTLTFNLIPYQAQPLNGVYWSLPVEWNYYLVLPLLACAVLRLGWGRTAVAVLLLVLGFRWACYSTVWELPPSGWLSWWAGSIHQLPARLDQFVLGMLAAHLHQRCAGLAHERIFLQALAGLWLCSYWLGSRGDGFSRVDVPLVFVQFTALGLLYAALCLGAAGSGRWARWLCANPLMLQLGTISYSLYLWHYPILHWQRHWTWLHDLGPLLSVTLTAMIILAVSALSYRWLERPFLPQAASSR
ncbi:MAG: acyltransferase [Lysobacterales bacterium]